MKSRLAPLKRILAILLILATFSSALVACKADNENITESDTDIASDIATDENGETVESTVTYYVLTNEAGSSVELDAETGDSIVKGVLNPVVLECVDYYAEETELAAYGLNAPVKLTVHYTEELAISTETSSSGKVETPMQYVITFGFVQSGEEKASAYMLLPDSDMVFSVDVSAFESLF